MLTNALIIGSTAMKYWYPEFKRNPKDLDLAVESKGELKNGDGVEYLPNPILFKEKWKKYWHKAEDGKNYLTPQGLLNLKVSHLRWDINFDKHLFDQNFLRQKGLETDYEFVRELVEFWDEHLPTVRRSKLDMSKEDFFTNAVNYDHLEHDQIHLLIDPIPMYTLLLKDGCEVELDESKWENLTFEQKCEVVRQECYCMSWERYKNMYYKAAYQKMLKSLIIKHLPPYIALFAIENYLSLYQPKYNFIDKIEKGLLIKNQQNELQIN